MTYRQCPVHQFPTTRRIFKDLGKGLLVLEEPAHHGLPVSTSGWIFCPQLHHTDDPSFNSLRLQLHNLVCVCVCVCVCEISVDHMMFCILTLLCQKKRDTQNH